MIHVHIIDRVNNGIREVDRDILPNGYLRQLDQPGFRSLLPTSRPRPASRSKKSCPYLLHIFTLPGSRRKLSLPFRPAIRQLLHSYVFISRRIVGPVKGKLGTPIRIQKMRFTPFLNDEFEVPVLEMLERLGEGIQSADARATYQG
ncbi:hypothetical protein DEO72_LG2g3299 [Vigna unguiculata]|uniref:Uncharacterized protein n=1 Tax=Vigna unguiculata TaxID=3917 RepID=A0A4D6L346_VIGUN|nr:hypothetical protein DEO72_LG2g3299 [Vigna unguiculata]